MKCGKMEQLFDGGFEQLFDYSILFVAFVYVLLFMFVLL